MPRDLPTRITSLPAGVGAEPNSVVGSWRDLRTEVESLAADVDRAEASLRRRIEALEERATDEADFPPRRVQSAPSKIVPEGGQFRLIEEGLDQEELPCLEDLFPADAVGSVSSSEWDEVMEAIAPFFTESNLALIGGIRESVTRSAPATITVDDVDWDESPMVQHTSQRSQRLAAQKTRWSDSKKMNRYKSTPFNKEIRGLHATLGEPQTLKAKQSARILQEWLNKAPTSEKPPPPKRSTSYGDSGVTDAEVRDAVATRVSQLLDSATRVSSVLPDLSRFLRQQADVITRHFSDYSSRYGATIPTAIKSVDVSSKVKKAYAAGGTSGIAWHGTRQHNVAAIKQHGLLIPGPRNLPGHLPDRPAIPVAHGQVHGRGVYASETPSIAAGYAGNDGALLMCAVNHSATHRAGSILVVEREANILPVFELRMKSYHGAELGKFVKSKAKPDVPKRPNASRIAASKEADRVAKLQPPPGFVETGHNPTGYVFPIQAQIDWARNALDELQKPRTDAVRLERRAKAKKISKTRAEASRSRFAGANDQHIAVSALDGGVVEVDDDGWTRQREQQQRHSTEHRRAAEKKAAVQRARSAHAYTQAERQLNEKAARVLKHRVANRGGRQGPAHEEERIARKLKKKQGRRPNKH